MHKLISNRFFWIAIGLLFLDIGYYYLLLAEGIKPVSAFSDALNSYFWLAFFSFVLQRIHSFYHSRSAVSIVHVSIVIVFSFFISLLAHLYGQWIGQEDQLYLNWLNKLFWARWFILFLLLLTLVNQLWMDKHLSDQKVALQRLLEKERQLAKAEINNLQQQFQPHFLFNSLNSISALVKIQPDKAREMIINLSDFLRLTIQKGKDDFNTIANEMAYLELYLSIEKVRFGNRLNVNFNIDDSCQKVEIPALLLQPLVENAIKYSVNSQTGVIEIAIRVSRQENHIRIEIENSFDPNFTSNQNGTGFGLQATERKLQYVYKQTSLLKIEKDEEKFRVKIIIPNV